VGSTFLGNAYAALAAFAGGTLLAHWLGPELRGVFELGLFAANSALLALGLGLNVATTVFIANQPARGLWAYRLGIRLAVIYAVFGAAVVLAARSFHVATESMSTTIALAVLLVFLALSTTQLVNGLLVGVGRIHWQNAAVAARWTAYLLLLGACSLAAVPAPDLALACYGVAALVACVVGWWGTRRSDIFSRAAPPGLTPPERRDVLWFGFRAQLANLFQFASYRFDVLLVGLWVGNAPLGVYAVGVMFTEALWLLPNAVGTVLLSHTSRFAREEADRRIVVAFTVTMGLVAAGAVVLSVASYLATRLYLGQSFAGVPEVTWLLMPGAIALSGSKVLANELTARGFPGVNTIVALCGAVVTLTGDVALIPRYGIVGAAIASSIGYTAAFALICVAFRTRLRGSVSS